MIIRAELRRKQSEYEGEACVIDKVIELPAQRFKQFSHALLADYDFIAENKNVIQYDADSRHCLLILDVVGTDGFLVDPQGYNYARYSAFVPNVRSLLTPDVEIDRSYLSLAEPWRDESRDEMLRMTLRVDGNEFGFLDECNMTLRKFCEVHDLPYPAEEEEFHIRPARPDEAGLFYAQHPSEDKSLVGRVTFVGDDAQEFTDAEAFLKCVREELPYFPTTGFRYEVLTDDPAVRKQVDDIFYDFFGEENPHQIEDYQNEPEQDMTFGGV